MPCVKKEYKQGPGVSISASVTTSAATELKLKKGMAASAVIKASSVMVGVE
jgi:molybdopterin-binding protein